MSPAPHLEVGLVITAMGCGGAERMLAMLANHLAGQGHQVTLHVLNEPETFFELHPTVEVRTFAAAPGAEGSRLTRPLRRVRWLRGELGRRRPDLVVSFIDVANMLTLLATRGTGVPVVVSERTNPLRHRVSWPYRLLRRLTYPSAASVVVQSEETAAWAASFVPAGRMMVMVNPVRAAETEGEPELALPSRRWLVGVGRLDPVKRFEELIDAFAPLAARHPMWSLLLLGEGPARARLEGAVRRHGLENRVWLPGAVRATDPVLRQCHLFALTSRYEGFPNALCEAMACGIPAVSFDCPTGPRVIVRDGVDGLLVPDGDVGAMRAALDRLMGDDGLRERLGSRAAEVVTRFAAAGILARWEALCVEVASSGNRREPRRRGSMA